MLPGIGHVGQMPSWVYQRYRNVWRRVVLAAGWSLLYVWIDSGLAGVHGLEGTAYSVQWRAVLAAFIFIGGLWKPVVAYAAFVAAVAYPLYLISIYVMALALAVLILAAPLVVRSLPLALMVLIGPVLAPFHLTPILPLLFGLWAVESPLGGWGRAGATVSGALCALWLKICSGMSGYSVDLWQSNGRAIGFASLYERFHTANSLQTLLLLVEPLVKDPQGNAATVLLFNVLQVFAWAGAAYVVSTVYDLLLSKTGRVGGRGVRVAMLSLVPGLLTIWAGYVAVPSWLRVPGPRWLDPLWLPAQVVLAGVVALGLDGLLRYLQQPLYARPQPVRISVPSARSRVKSKKRARQVDVPDRAVVNSVGGEARSGDSSFGRKSGRRASGDVLDGQVKVASQGNRERHRKPGDDIIMIELD